MKNLLEELSKKINRLEKELESEKRLSRGLEEALSCFCDPTQEFYVDHYVVKEDGSKVGVIKNIVQLSKFAHAAVVRAQEQKYEELDSE